MTPGVGGGTSNRRFTLRPLSIGAGLLNRVPLPKGGRRPPIALACGELLPPKVRLAGRSSPREPEMTTWGHRAPLVRGAFESPLRCRGSFMQNGDRHLFAFQKYPCVKSANAKRCLSPFCIHLEWCRRPDTTNPPQD